MHKTAYLYFSTKLLEVCNSDVGASIYSLVPEINHDFSHIIENHQTILNSSLKIFGTNTSQRSNSDLFSKILEKKEEAFKDYSNFFAFKKKEIPNISTERNNVSLALLSNVYLNTFIKPIQAFIPHSTSCSGQWNFWELIDYSNIKEQLGDKNVILELIGNLEKGDAWDISSIPIDTFTPINRRRIEKEKSLEKPLDREALIKAIIIRLGELAAPSMRYEILDVAIRKYLRDLDINKYLRVDVEMAFLLRLENKIMDLLKNQKF